MSREEEKAYAELHGYFWLPCPMCGEDFGGHEKGGGSLILDYGKGLVTCKKCKTRADELNKRIQPIWGRITGNEHKIAHLNRIMPHICRTCKSELFIKDIGHLCPLAGEDIEPNDLCHIGKWELKE